MSPITAPAVQIVGGLPSSALPNLTGRYIGSGRYKIDKLIGQGSFGLVYLGKRNPPLGQSSKAGSNALSEYVAIKNPVDGRNTSIRYEIKYQSQAAAVSPNVLGVTEVIDDDDWNQTFIVTELASNGDLFDVLREPEGRKRFESDEEVREVFLQILDAVAAFHDRGIYHRDLKPENILCTDGPEGKQTLIADFGFATKNGYSTGFGRGTELYMSPEVIGGLRLALRCYSCKDADVWALAIILFNLVCGGMCPWKKACLKDDEFKKHISNPNYLRQTYALSEELADVFNCALGESSRTRLTLDELRVQVRAIKKMRMPGWQRVHREREFMLKMKAERERKAALEAFEARRAAIFGMGKMRPAVLEALETDVVVNNLRRSASSYLPRSSMDSASFEVPLCDRIGSSGIIVGSRKWPSNVVPSTNGHDSPLMSAFLGNDDIDSILPVETAPAPAPSLANTQNGAVPTRPRARPPLRVCNPSPSTDSESDYGTDADSSEAVTPETHAAATPAGDADVVPALVLNLDRLKLTAHDSTSATSSETGPLLFPIPAAKLSPTAVAFVDTLATGIDGTYTASQNMLMVAARRLRTRRSAGKTGNLFQVPL